jgi:hypothetical protein
MARIAMMTDNGRRRRKMLMQTFADAVAVAAANGNDDDSSDARVGSNQISRRERMFRLLVSPKTLLFETFDQLSERSSRIACLWKCPCGLLVAIGGTVKEQQHRDWVFALFARLLLHQCSRSFGLPPESLDMCHRPRRDRRATFLDRAGEPSPPRCPVALRPVPGNVASVIGHFWTGVLPLSLLADLRWHIPIFPKR